MIEDENVVPNQNTTSEEADIDNSALPESPASSAPVEFGASPTVTFRGNNYDLMSVVGATVAGMLLFTCATCNLGFYCLPVIPVVLGIIGLVSLNESVDQERTRMLSWISIGIGGAILLLLVTFIVLYFGVLIFAIAAESGGGF